jgi:hypothetical protein
MSNTLLPPPETFRSVACRVTEAHHDIIRRAAEMQGKTVAGYSRAILVAWACSDVGAGPPDLSVYSHVDLVAEASKRLGISAKEFAHRAAHQAAVAALRPASDIRELKPGIVKRRATYG